MLSSFGTIGVASVVKTGGSNLGSANSSVTFVPSFHFCSNPVDATPRFRGLGEGEWSGTGSEENGGVGVLVVVISGLTGLPSVVVRGLGCSVGLGLVLTS